MLKVYIYLSIYTYIIFWISPLILDLYFIMLSVK